MIVDRVKSALPIEGIPVFDCHGHLGRWPLTHMPGHTIEATIATLDRLGIDRLCLSPFWGCFCDFVRGNDALGAAVARYSDRLIGQITVNPHYPDEIVPEIERCRRLYGVRMLKIHPFCHDYPVDGDGYRPLWEYADQTGTVVLSHTWDSDKTCSPELFATIAARYLRARVILAHAGGTQRGCRQAIDVVKKHGGLYLDTATSHFHVGMIERFVREVGADRVLFGSDVPLLDPAAPLGRIAYARIGEAQKEKILGLNLRGLLDDCGGRPQ
jgi:hypothetical protein